MIIGFCMCFCAAAGFSWRSDRTYSKKQKKLCETSTWIAPPNLEKTSRVALGYLSHYGICENVLDLRVLHTLSL